MSQSPIKIYERDVYGTVRIYPANKEAELFAEIAGTTTLTEHTIKCIKDLGFEVQQVLPPRAGS